MTYSMKAKNKKATIRHRAKCNKLVDTNFNKFLILVAVSLLRKHSKIIHKQKITRHVKITIGSSPELCKESRIKPTIIIAKNMKVYNLVR
jgi:hypothetical protein